MIESLCQINQNEALTNFGSAFTSYCIQGTFRFNRYEFSRKRSSIFLSSERSSPCCSLFLRQILYLHCSPFFSKSPYLSRLYTWFQRLLVGEDSQERAFGAFYSDHNFILKQYVDLDGNSMTDAQRS